MRATRQTFILTIILGLTAGVSVSAAQDRVQDPARDTNLQRPAPARLAGAGETTGSGGFAPIGHRQPTKRSVGEPAGEQDRPSIDPLGPLPQICKGC